MIVQLHTKNGVINIDSGKVTDVELADLKMTRQDLNDMMPRDLRTEIDELDLRLKKLEKV